MMLSCNRFALFPCMCSECKRYIWMEPYRRSDVWHGGFVDRYFKGDYKKENICKKCLPKFLPKTEQDTTAKKNNSFYERRVIYYGYQNKTYTD